MTVRTATDRITRRFVGVDGRQLHCRVMGSGPPALFIHASPANSSLVVPEMTAVAHRYTCFAFDTPGFGLSEPLPGDPLEIGDLADALAATLAAIGMPPVPVFGTHTGAAIALELALRHPERVTGLMIDGLSCFTAAEAAVLVDGYFKPFAPDPLGGHFSATWTRFRDQSIWFPWFARSPHAYNAIDLGSPASIDRWLTMYFDAVDSYVPAYRSALEYSQGPARVAELQVPAVFTALASDMLYPHLDRLPAAAEVRRVGNDLAARRALTAQAFVRFGSRGVAPVLRAARTASTRVVRQFVDVGHGQLFVRTAGDPANPALLVLHDLPGTSEAVEARLLVLSRTHFAVAFDLPGCGHSDALPEPEIGGYAAALDAGRVALGMGGCAVWGIGWSSSIAVELARLGGAHSVALEGLALPDDAERADLLAHYGVACDLDGAGNHWFATWQMLRDMEVWWPWYRRQHSAHRSVAGDFDAQSLHRRTCEVRRQPRGHVDAIAAILAYDAAAALGGLRMAVTRIDGSDNAVAIAYAGKLAGLVAEGVPRARLEGL